MIGPYYNALYSLVFSYLSFNGSTGPTVDLGYAQYQGFIEPLSGNVNFLGIRYADEPTGHLRFSEPHAPPVVEGIQQADVPPPVCYQGTMGNSPLSFVRSGEMSTNVAVPNRPGSFSEDCLFLNVYAPGNDIAADSPTGLLPVVVWIHGGGYAIGGTTGLFGSDPFDGNDLVREAGNRVVAVVIQYRLGAFGFLGGEKVKTGGALNAGLLDQQFALRWVQEHISKFGGDPSKVTLFGHSAGADSIIQHNIANDGKTDPPLFRAGMLSSFFLPPQYEYNHAIVETIYDEVVKQANCSESSDTLECLRGVDTNTLDKANYNIAVSGFHGSFTFVPVVDGSFITRRPIEAFKQKKVNTKNILATTTTLEGGPFVSPEIAANTQTSDYVAQLFPTLNEKQVSAVAKLYHRAKTEYPSVPFAIMSEAIFVCPSYYLLQNVDGNIYKGLFAVPPGFHGQEVGYYFPASVPGGIPSYNNTEFLKAFSGAYMNYVMHLDPNKKWEPTITPRWSTWKEQGAHTEMLFNRTEAGDPLVKSFSTPPDVIDRCKFWESIGAYTAQ